MDNWIKTTGAVLHGVEYFPPLAPVGGGAAQVFSSSPSGGSASMELMYLMAITAATADDPPVELVLRARRARGQDDGRGAQARRAGCRSSRPGEHIDTETVRAASRARWGELLAAGAEIYEYQPTMYHCKVMIVDEFMVSVGSTNFDDRSFRLNDEANLNIYDRDVRARAGADLRRRPGALAPHRAGRVAGAAAARKGARAPGLAARLAALAAAASPAAGAAATMAFGDAAGGLNWQARGWRTAGASWPSTSGRRRRR